ncbi:MAG: hypothetical protein AAFX80_05630 [Cyanobacteria bacterium J06639_18]
MKWEFRSQELGVRSQESGIRSQKSEVRSQLQGELIFCWTHLQAGIKLLRSTETG